MNAFTTFSEGKKISQGNKDHEYPGHIQVIKIIKKKKIIIIIIIIMKIMKLLIMIITIKMIVNNKNENDSK